MSEDADNQLFKGRCELLVLLLLLLLLLLLWGGGGCLFVLINAAKLAEFQRFSFQVVMVLFIVTILALITLII